MDLSTTDLSDIDLLDRDRYVEGVPHEWFTRLRQHAPIYRHPEPNGPGFWVFSKYDDVAAIGRDAGTFSSSAERGGVIMLTTVLILTTINTILQAIAVYQRHQTLQEHRKNGDSE